MARIASYGQPRPVSGAEKAAAVLACEARHHSLRVTFAGPRRVQLRTTDGAIVRQFATAARAFRWLERRG